MVIKHLHYIAEFSSKIRKAFRREMALENSALFHDVEAAWGSSTFSDPFLSYRNEKNTKKTRGGQNLGREASGTGKVKGREEYL